VKTFAALCAAAAVATLGALTGWLVLLTWVASRM